MLELVCHRGGSAEAGGGAPGAGAPLGLAGLTDFISNPEFSGQLGWKGSPQVFLAAYVNGLKKRCQALLNATNPHRVVLLGMGGAVMGALALRDLYGGERAERLVVIDTTNPGSLAEISAAIDCRRSLFIVASKSGTTIETLALMEHFFALATEELGVEGARARFVAITDPDTALSSRAREYGFASVFFSNPQIGGRFSLFTPFGIVPPTLARIDVMSLLERAALVCGNGALCQDCLERAGIFARHLREQALAGRRKIVIRYAPRLRGLALWLEQLIAESTGKGALALLPIVGGDASVIAKDDVIVLFLTDAAGDEPAPSVAAYGEVAVDVWESRINDTAAAGPWFYFWMLVVSIYGNAAGINPFDQPHVEMSKVLSWQFYTDAEKVNAANADVVSLSPTEALLPAALAKVHSFLRDARNDADYIAIISGIGKEAPLSQDGFEVGAWGLERLREVVSELSGKWVTLNTLPRYLHSTGQLHKGDEGRGFFLFLTQRFAAAMPVKIGNTAGSFARLFEAQVCGDIGALRRYGRQVMRVHMDTSNVGNADVLLGILAQRLRDVAL